MRIGVKLETEKQKSLQKSLRNQKSLLDYYSRKPLDKTFFLFPLTSPTLQTENSSWHHMILILMEFSLRVYETLQYIQCLRQVVEIYYSIWHC